MYNEKYIRLQVSFAKKFYLKLISEVSKVKNKNKREEDEVRNLAFRRHHAILYR